MSVAGDHAVRISDDLVEAARRAIERVHGSDSGAQLKFGEAIRRALDLRAVVLQADEEQIIDGMPSILGLRLASYVEQVYLQLRLIAEGNDSLSTFANAVDELHKSIWEWGLEVRLKRQKGWFHKVHDANHHLTKLAQAELEAGEAVRAVAAMLDETSRNRSMTADYSRNANQAFQEVSEAEAIAKDSMAQISQIMSEIKQLVALAQSQSTEIDKSTGLAHAAVQSSTSYVTRLEQHYADVEANEAKIKSVILSAETAYGDYGARTNELIEKNLTIQKDIEEKLQVATGYTLFETFGKRRKEIKRGLVVWLVLAAIAAPASFFYAGHLLQGVTQLSVAFFIKLGLTLPAIIFVAFTVRQYTRERRLEEEYAFKASISLSLMAYWDLVKEVLDTLSPEEKKAYGGFLIDSINTIFEPPMDKVFSERRVRAVSDTKIISQAVETLKPIIDLIQTK